MSDYEFIRYEPVEDSDVVVITLNRPEKLNAISSPLAAELADAFHRFDAGSAFVAILAGAGRAFTAGMDVLENMAAGRTVMASPDLGDSYNPFHPGQVVGDGSPGPAAHHARTLKKLVIAAVHGYVFGGGFIMAMAADLCVAAESAVFEFSEVYRGMAVGWDMGYLYRFPRNISMELALGLRMEARRAYELGLVNRLVPDEDLLPSAIGLARQLCERPRGAVTANRDLVDALIPTIPEQVAAEAEEARRRLAGSPESTAAFAKFAEAHGYSTR
jgi:enoyl-CoA hydratase/carnithine racemase